MTHYDYAGGKPFEIQKRTVELLTENPEGLRPQFDGHGKDQVGSVVFRFFTLAKFGKTDAGYRASKHSPIRLGARGLRHLPAFEVNVLHGPGGRAKRLKLLAEPADIYVINPDGLGVVIDEVIKRKDIDVICIDELAMFRNHTLRTKLLKRIARSKVIVWGMTGAPMPNASDRRLPSGADRDAPHLPDVVRAVS